MSQAVRRGLKYILGADALVESTWRTTRRALRVTLNVIGISVSGVCVANTFFNVVGYPASISGGSMRPCLNHTSHYPSLDWLRLNLDWVFVNVWSARHWNKFERGDIVVFLSPKDPNDFVIKRLIAFEGDVILRPEGEVEIPKGHIWVEGDNSRNSIDSKHYGPVPLGLVFAKATHVIWPPQNWKKIQPSLENHVDKDIRELDSGHSMIISHL